MTAQIKAIIGILLVIILIVGGLQAKSLYDEFMGLREFKAAQDAVSTGTTAAADGLTKQSDNATTQVNDVSFRRAGIQERERGIARENPKVDEFFNYVVPAELRDADREARGHGSPSVPGRDEGTGSPANSAGPNKIPISG